MPRKKTFEEHVEDFRKVHGDKFEYPVQEPTKGSLTKIDIVCNTCENAFSQTINSHKNGYGCTYCAGQKLANLGEKILCDDGIEREVISPKIAKEKGLDKYFTGKPCVGAGHVSERYLHGVCVNCREKYNRNRYATDNVYKTSRTVRNMLRRVLKAAKQGKFESTFEVLGYPPEEFMTSIESKMLEGMSWENHGEWHIDHRIGVNEYISRGIADPAIINSLDNLFPMWAEHNLSKNSKSLEDYLDSRPELEELYGHFMLDSQPSDVYTGDSHIKEE